MNKSIESTNPDSVPRTIEPFFFFFKSKDHRTLNQQNGHEMPVLVMVKGF